MSGTGKRRIKVRWAADGYSGVSHAYERSGTPVGFKDTAMCGQKMPYPYYIGERDIQCSACTITLKQRW